jgi:hypothetical protein
MHGTTTSTTPRFLPLLLTLALVSLAPAANPGVPWPATDALGRRLPMAAQVGRPRSDRFVAIFYFLWHEGGGEGSAESQRGPYDISKIFAADPAALGKPDSPLWGPIGFSHYWGEPLFGYYRSDDPWVLRHHAQMLADAGVDTLIFDTTNAVTYREVYMKLCEVFTTVRSEGGRTPQIAFMTNTQADATAQQIYRDLYKPGRYADLWFRWHGKPLMICDPKEASPDLQKFFTLRKAHWPFQMINTANAWHWEATYPQPYGYTDDPKKPEQVNVSVAQNLRASDGQVTNMSNGDARGRGFHDGRPDRSRAALDRGANFEEQWRRARKLDPPVVMVTGWNEWIAGRFPGNRTSTFVDQFDEQFSRDIEPMRGGHGDNFYYQLVSGVRSFKGVPAIPAVSARPIQVDGRFDEWKAVEPEFLDTCGDTAPRNHAGVGKAGPYVDKSGRNDLVGAKVSWDEANIYYYVRTRQPITPHTDPNWMLLLIDIDSNPATGWLGYDFIVNQTNVRPRTTTLQRHAGGSRWAASVDIPYCLSGNEMELAIPRSALGLTKLPATIDFKWADNIRLDGDASEFSLHGDAAPNERFNFRAVLNNQPKLQVVGW